MLNILPAETRKKLQADPLFRKTVEVAEAVRQSGGRALLVGGYVRDMLLGLSPKDADIEVYGIEAEALRALLKRLGRVDCVGESFRVYKLVWHGKSTSSKSTLEESASGKSTSPKSTSGARYELDVSLPRRDKKVGAGHRGFVVEGDPFSTVEDAARRRDFTVNAILLDPLSGELLDPFGGRADLDNRVLRVVDPAHFAEDSLRVLRAVQFAARFEMQIEEESAALCRSIDLSDLPKERVWGEFEKWLLKSQKPSVGLAIAEQLLVFEKLLPFLSRALERDAESMKSTLDAAAQERKGLSHPRQVTLMLSVLGIFLGRSELKVLLDVLGVFRIGGYNVRKQTIILAGERKRVRDWFRTRSEIVDREFRFLSARLEPVMLYKLARARGDLEAAEWFKTKMLELDVWSGPPEPLIQGRHLLELGLQPGPEVGKILEKLWIAQLSGEFTNFEQARTAAEKLVGFGS